MTDTPNNLVLGMVAKKINALMDSGLSFDKSFEQFKTTSSEGYKKYNLDACKSQILAKVNQKRVNCKDCEPKEEPKKEKELPKKEKAKKKEKPAVSEKPEEKPVEKPASVVNPTPAIITPPVKGKGFKLPVAMKGEGKVDFIEHKDGGVVLKKTDKSKKLAILCGEGTHGKVLDDDTIGCEFD